MRLARRILITNYVLDKGTGTEMYVYDLAVRLIALGRLPVVYCPRPGLLARRMRSEGIAVVENLSELGATPDLIHGHHTLETLSAMLRFPYTPTVFVCHDSAAWHDTAPRLPGICHFLGVDQACYDRLVFTHGVPAEMASILPNGVHLGRFPIRAHLPDRPTSALLFGHDFQAQHLEMLRQACPDLQVDSIGSNTHRILTEPGGKLLQFDIVFARGRSAREALASGAATIVADPTGMDQMVTLDRYEFVQNNNFGRRLLRQPLSVASIRIAVDQYNAQNARQVAMHHRNSNDLDVVVDALVALYDQIVTEFDPASVHLESLLGLVSYWVQWASLHANVIHPTQPARTALPLPTLNTQARSQTALSPMVLPQGQVDQRPISDMAECLPKRKRTTEKVKREFGRIVRQFRRRAAAL